MKNIMQNALFIIAGLLLVVGAVIFWGFKPFGIVHIMLLSAGILIFIGFFFSNRISRRIRKSKKDL
jgi:uncharacterized RDD family membrane protein YckC